MTLVIEQGDGDKVHTPKRRDVFEFDKDVADIFENMAVRSIPMYAEVHNVHSILAKDHIENLYNTFGGIYNVHLADVGSSTGVFIKALMHTYGCDDFKVQLDTYLRGGLDVVAIDPSVDMNHKLSMQLPWVTTINHGVDSMKDMPGYFDIVNLAYVLQFIRPEYQSETLQTIAKSMTTGGMLLLAQKETQVNTQMTANFSRHYIQFRRDNGYSDEEIVTKTAALHNSMWPLPYAKLLQYLEEAGFVDIQETTRWLNFNSLVCYKG